jgi:nucleoside-diphosphate-sugar epimerase
MRILITGHRGYIGPHAVELAAQRGWRVTGCDLGLYEGRNWAPLPACEDEWRRDFRTLRPADLEGFDAIVHLAAISNDPLGELEAELTRDVNARGTIELARAAREAGVPRFVFASSCAMYGAGVREHLCEDDALSPLSVYAESKIEAERGLRALDGDGFSTVSMRNATAYGDSPMLRLDIVANDFLSSAHARGEIRIKSDGTPWRPLVHCRDIASAALDAACAPTEDVGGMAFNVGANAENYRVRDVAEIVGALVPTAHVVFTGETGPDPRDYRVSFDLLEERIPEFEVGFDLARGLEDLLAKMADRGLTDADLDGGRYVRLRALPARLDLLREVATP